MIGGGFIGPVHVEALRRIGVEVVGLLGSSPERARRRGRSAGDRAGLPRPRTSSWTIERVGSRPHRVAQRAPLRAGASRPGVGPPCDLREAAGNVDARKPRRCEHWPSRGRRRRPRSTTTSATIPSATRSAIGSPSGDLGRVLSVTGSYVQDWLLYPEDYNWRVEPDGRTNLRAVADIGTHWMDLAQFLTGMPIRSVNADLATFHPRRFKPVGPTDTFSGSTAAGSRPVRDVAITTDDHGAVLLRFDSGVRGAFHVSQVTAGRKNRLTIEIAATEGAVAWDSESPNRLWIGSRRGPNQVLERDPALLGPAAAAISHYPGGHAEGFPDTFKQLYARHLRLDRRGAGCRPGADLSHLRRRRP